MHSADPVRAASRRSASLQLEFGERHHLAQRLAASHAHGPSLRQPGSGSAGPTGSPARCLSHRELHLAACPSRRPQRPPGQPSRPRKTLAAPSTARQSSASVEAAALRHQRNDADAVLLPVRCGASRAATVVFDSNCFISVMVSDCWPCLKCRHCSGLMDHIQKNTVAAMQIVDMNICPDDCGRKTRSWTLCLSKTTHGITRRWASWAGWLSSKRGLRAKEACEAKLLVERSILAKVDPA